MTNMKKFYAFRLDIACMESVHHLNEDVVAIFPEWDQGEVAVMWYNFHRGRNIQHLINFFRAVMPGATANISVESDKFSVNIQSGDYRYETILNGDKIEDRVISGFSVGTVHDHLTTCFLMAMTDAYYAEYLTEKDS